MLCNLISYNILARGGFFLTPSIFTDGLANAVQTACGGSLPAITNPTRGTVCVAKDSVFQVYINLLHTK